MRKRATTTGPMLAWPVMAALLLATVVPAAQAATPADALQTWIWSDPYATADLDDLVTALGRAGLPLHVLDTLGMVTFQADAVTAHALQRLVGGRLDADHAVDLHLDRTVPFIGADRVRAAVGPARSGPTVLVVDTGIDSAHPDFAQGANLAADVQPVRIGGLVVATREDAPVIDEAGHGTHVAGVVAGSGQSLGNQDELHGRFTGVYANGRVASYKASSIQEGAEAEVEVVAALEAFEWALDNQQRLDLLVVTNSWGETGAFEPDGPVSYATKRLYLAGMTVVFSAGNSGEEGASSLNRYCVAPWVLCVAAGDLERSRMDFSSRGSNDPTKPYDHPDLTAPGVDVTAARPVQQGVLDVAGLLPSLEHPSRRLYVDRSGTSIAAPHVAGAAALLLAANPGLSPDQVMDLLVTTTHPMAGALAEVGTGYLDVEAAYEAALTTPGERAAFLRGDAVRYAGAASGDVEYALDPVTVGELGQAPSSGLRERTERLWVLTPLGAALALVTLALLLVGTRRAR